MYVVLFLCFLVFLLFLYNHMLKSSDRWKKLSQYPGDEPWPFLGNGIQLGFDADDASYKLMALWEKHGKQNYRVTLGSEDWVLLTEPDDIGTILNHPTELSKPSERHVAMKPFFGDSLSGLEGEKWKSMRKLMIPSFQYNTFQDRLEEVNKSCDRLYHIFDTYDGKGPVDVYRYLRPLMYDVLSGTLLGIVSNLLENPDHPYLKASKEAIKFMTYNYFSYWRNIRTLFMMTPMYWEMVRIINVMRSNSTNIINKRREKIQELRNETINKKNIVDNETDSNCLLDYFLLTELQNGESVPDEFITDEVTFLCFTGHYTTSVTISHTLYCLAKYPDIQKKVIEEQRLIFDKNLNKDTSIQDLNEMKYLEAVIKETIRVIPTITKIGRTLRNDLKFKDGRVVPAGTSVIVFYQALYQNPKVFPEPDLYKPERHLEPMHTFSLVPFSAGPRKCIGFRYAWVVMKATLSNILRRYEVLPGGPGTEPQFIHRIVTESKNGLQLRLRARETIL